MNNVICGCLKFFLLPNRSPKALDCLYMGKIRNVKTGVAIKQPGLESVFSAISPLARQAELCLQALAIAQAQQACT